MISWKSLNFLKNPVCIWYGICKTLKTKQRKPKGWISLYVIRYIARNLLTGKVVIRADEGMIRAGEETIRVG